MITVPIPDRMKRLERDRRGYPIPQAVYRDAEGRPHFTINDEAIRQKHIRGDLCPICGFRLLRGRWFVGGPRSAFHEHGVYIDPPMHRECAQYALQVCPYLAAPSYGRRLDARTLKPGDPIGPLLLDPTMDPNRPEVFIAAMARGQRWILESGTPIIKYLRPHRPYIQVEAWRGGKQIEWEPAEAAGG